MNYKEKIKELVKDGCSANEISEHLKRINLRPVALVR